eukprot:m.269677 g.269677  ORF g.269677 m.269677 type:complete len:205 (-) comp85761_c0_seq1:196-810(-)
MIRHNLFALKRLASRLQHQKAALIPTYYFCRGMSRDVPLPCAETWHVPSTVVNVPAQLQDGDHTEQVVVDNSCDVAAVLVSVHLTESSTTSSPKWNTLQIGEHLHALFGHKALKLNHATEPNTQIVIHEDRVELIATRSLTAKEALSFNYNTTEWLMDEPFTDWVTGLRVQGFSKASRSEQTMLLQSDLLAPHIRQLAESLAQK